MNRHPSIVVKLFSNGQVESMHESNIYVVSYLVFNHMGVQNVWDN